MNRAYAIWSSGVDRWHASRSHALQRSCDTTDAHTARCLHLLFALWPEKDTPPIALVKAILDHDVPEAWAGDTPAPAKRSVALRQALYDEECAVGDALGLSHTPNLAFRYQAWLKLVDSLDAYLWAWRIDPVEAARSEWASLHDAILKRTEEADAGIYSDLYGRVAALMEYAESGGTRQEVLK